MLQPAVADVLGGLVPDLALARDPEAFYLAVGIVGATVMPHNLYLHSSIVQTRVSRPTEAAKREGIRWATLDIVVALLLAMLVNAAILIVAATAFHAGGQTGVTEIDQAYRLLSPVTGNMLAPILFGVALLVSGQSSTFTGTVAGQVILEGFVNLKIPCYQRRLITRALALGPALVGELWLGEGSVGRLLVLSQVVLTVQLPFALWPLIRFTSDRKVMGVFASGPLVKSAGWIVFAAIAAANFWLIGGMFGG
jgi:manganese transport protein